MAQIKTERGSFTLKSGETVLDGLLRTGHAVEYQCREGYCGSCRMRVQGEFHYIRTPLAFTLPGEIIACCAIPKTDIVLDAAFIAALHTG